MRLNDVLAEIWSTGRVGVGDSAVMLKDQVPDYAGELIYRTFRDVRPDVSIEVGLAYGVSALYAAQAIEENGAGRHIIIDPFQRSDWRGIGWENLTRAGYARFCELIEEGSEQALPRLVRGGVRIQAAIIDGLHHFDQAMLEVYYLNRMLDVGGVLLFDDSNSPPIAHLLSFLAQYPCFEVIETVGKTPKARYAVGAALAGAVGAVSEALAFKTFADPRVRFRRLTALRKIKPDEGRPDHWHAWF